MIRAAALAIALPLAGCGYHLAHVPADPLGPFTITSGAARVPDVTVIAAAEDGARAELARAGALGGGGGTIELEVLGVEEEGEAIALDAARTPLARGARITVTVRAILRKAGDGDSTRDSGDVRMSEVVVRTRDTARGLVTASEAARSAARRAGELSVKRVLGSPEPGGP